MDKKRNEFLESGGLFFESDTHEWFKDKDTTDWAHKEDLQGTSLPNIYGFITRDKSTGEYMRVLMDNETNEVVFDHKSLEAVGVRIDIMKVHKRTEK